MNSAEGVEAALADDPRCIYDRDSDGMTALHWSCINNNKVITKILVDFRKEVDGEIIEADCTAEDIHGRPPIKFAIASGNKGLSELFRERLFPKLFDPHSEWNNDPEAFRPDI